MKHSLEISGCRLFFDERMILSDIYREKARVDHLSSGMHRLVEIYIILKSETQFILLDEPFTHISPIQMSMIESIITSEAVNKGFLITDHMYRHIRNICTPIYLLSDGKTYLVKENDDLRRLGYLPSE